MKTNQEFVSRKRKKKSVNIFHIILFLSKKAVPLQPIFKSSFESEINSLYAYNSAISKKGQDETC